MKHWCIFLTLVHLTPNLFGQRDYIVIDSTKSFGIELINGGEKNNSSICRVKKGDKVIVYSPDEVKEFGFKEDKSYESFPIRLGDTISLYFLERLAKGKVNLYYLRLNGKIRKYYLIEEDSTNLIEIPQRKAEYQDLLGLIVKDCPKAVDNIPFICFRKYSLQRFIQDYNNCVNRPMPHLRYGLAIRLNSKPYRKCGIGLLTQLLK